MKITDIRILHCGAPAEPEARLDRVWTFVTIKTDEGVQGVGECSVFRLNQAVAEVVHRFATFLIGQDPTRVEHLWQQMYRHPFFRGGPIMNAAISGIDQALWDIAGKVAGLPVYKMLGGPVRDRVRAYARGDLGGTTVEQVLEAGRAGFTAFKLSPPHPEEGFNEYTVAQAAADQVAEVRQAVGHDMDLMVDFHGRLSPAAAVRFLDLVRDHGLLFAEELIPPDNVPAYAQVTAAVPEVPCATGERLYTRWGFRELIESRAVHVIQPDICYAGGISELRRIAAHAETHYISMAPHNPNGPVAAAANIHLAAATPNFLILEYARKPPYFEHVLHQPLVLTEGHFGLPDAPGLGVDLDEDYLKSHPPHELTIPSDWYADGSVADV
jgi:galactonate dehydratase